MLVMHGIGIYNSQVIGTICYHEGDVWNAILSATADIPKSVWVLGGGDDKKLNPSYVEQFVLKDGSVFRTHQKHEEILKLCRKYRENLESLVEEVFGDAGATFKVAREKNTWKPTPKNFLENVQCGCVHFGHGGLSCHTDGHNTENMVSLDMAASYSGSFTGMGNCSPNFERFEHPANLVIRVAINGSLPEKNLTGFAQINSWEFDSVVHPVIPAWFGRHLSVPHNDENARNGRGWAPIAFLR